jgi:hypothetical protein
LGKPHSNAIDIGTYSEYHLQQINRISNIHVCGWNLPDFIGIHTIGIWNGNYSPFMDVLDV